jgi:hypothetical protein
MELAKTAEEGVVRCGVQPTPTNGGGTDECGRKADAEQDLDEEVVVIEHLRYRHQ